MNRRELLQSIVQAILFALFGKRAGELSAATVARVTATAEKMLFRGGAFQISVLLKGFEVDGW